MEQINFEQLKTSAEKAAGLLKSMSHSGRLMLLCHLMDGESSVGQLNRAVPLSQSALSQHLANLRRAGLVDTRRAGQIIYYRLKSQAVSDILQSLHQIYCRQERKEDGK